MRLIRLILIDLTLMLLAPDIAQAMNMGAGADFTLVAKAVAPFKPIAGPEAVSSSGDSRHLYSQTAQAVPFQLSANAPGTAKLAENSAILEWRFACVIGKRAEQRSIATRLDGAGTLKMPAAVTRSICNPAAAPFGLVGTETARWSETDWIVGGMVIIAFAAILFVTLIERYSTSAGA